MIWADYAERGRLIKTLIQIRAMCEISRPASAANQGRLGDLLTSAEKIELAGEPHLLWSCRISPIVSRPWRALSKSEAELRALFAAMPDLVMVIDKDGRYTSIAPTAHNLLYRPPEELIGKTIADVFPQEQAAEFLDSIRTALKENRTFHLEYSLVIEEKIVWFTASISPMTEEMVVWIARDITERKQAEEMIRRSAEELKLAQSFAHVGSFAWDLKAGRLELSDELNRIFGFKKKIAPDLMVNALIKTIHPDDQKVVEEIFASIAREEKPAPHQFHILWPDGSVHLILAETGEFNLDEAGKPAMIKGIAQDITERSRAEEALLQSEELFRTAFRTSPDSININRLEDGLYVDINEGFTSMTGYTREETLGRTSVEINIWVDLADRRRLVEGLQKDGQVNNLEAKFRMKDGRVLTGLMSAKVIQLKGVPHILSITRNIEEIKRAEIALRESNKELARLYRASGALISGAFLNTGEQAQKIVEVVQQEFGQDNCSLFIIQEDSNELVRLATAGPYADQVRNAKLTLDGNGLVARAIRKGETINVPDVHADPDYVPNWDEAQSELAIPLKIGENVIGAIDVQSSQLNAFSPDDERPMTIFAERAALILEHSRLSTQMETRIQQLVALRTVDMAISGSFDINLTLGVLLDQVMGQLGAHAADILIFNAATQTFKFACERGFRLQTLRHIQLKYGTGYVWRAVRERQVINIPDINAGPDGLQRSPDLSSEHFVTYLGIPLIAKGQIRGVLEVFHREPVRFEPEKNSFLEILAGQAAIAIDNAELFDNLQSSNSDLSLAYEKTLEGWANALELRDQTTVGHTRRTTELTIRLARAMGIKDSDIVHLYRGALLHDIGKMGVPDSIVLKRDPLTEEEWVSMRKHPQYAYDMLSPISYLHLALDIPYCHHERWDGSGYPRGLKGDQIPLSARIFAVVDVWDALTSERPYRKEWTQAKARQYMKENAGKQFDPEVVKVFLREIK